MKSIRVLSQKSTGLDPSLAKASVIEVEDDVLGEGAFGVARRALAFDGHKVTPQVIKLLTRTKDGIAQRGFETIQELQKRLSDKNTALLNTGTTLLAKYPALQGVPQLSFEGQFEGRAVVGYSANDLSAAGFEEFGKILEDPAKLTQFQTLPLGPKLQLALQLVTAFRLLSSDLRFIHADIKADAVFIDPDKARCAIIDYDSGALARTALDSPLTYGTLQEWLAPEIIHQLSPTNQSGQIKVDLFSDVWSVNIALHYLLFTLPPFFFFKEISERSIKAYGQRFKWPDVDVSFPYFDQQYASVHAQYTHFLRTRLPAEIVKKFEFTFNYGFSDPNRRTSYGQWESVLQAAERPVIHFFQADRTFVNDTRPVRLTWNVGGAAHIEIKGLANVMGRGWIDVNVIRDTVFELILTSFSGQRTSKSIHIKMSKAPPVIQFFKSSSLLLTNSNPAQLSWQVSGSEQIQIDNGVGDVTARNNIEVGPREETTYTLTATSPFGVSARAVLRIQVSDAPPSIIYFNSDRVLLADRSPVTLNWSVSNDAHEVSIDEVGAVPQKGSVTVTQRRDTTYVLTATSYFGNSTCRSLQVLVSKEPPTIEEFKISPAFLREGMNASVQWKVTGAEKVFLDPQAGEVATAGYISVCIPPSGRMVLRAVSYFGATATQEASVAILRKTVLTMKRTELTRKH